MIKGMLNAIEIVVISLIGFSAMLLPSVSLSQNFMVLQPQQQFDAARARGNLSMAIEFGHQALNLAEQQYGKDSLEIASVLEMLGEVSALSGDYDNARIYYQRAVAIKEKAFGADHPALVGTLESLVDVELQQKTYVDAEFLLKRILQIERSAFGKKHENVLITLGRLRELYERTDRMQDAEDIASLLDASKFHAKSLPFEPSAADDGFSVVRVFYGTNRAPSGNMKPSQFYGNERGELSRGYVDVSIPETHKYGELETSSHWSIFSYTLGEDALKKKFVLLLDIENLDENNFHSQLRAHVEKSLSNDIFVFIHGFNTSFEDAARRAAQLAYDLDFDGTPIMYSWPSQASMMSYAADEAVVSISGRKMADFLGGLVERSGAGRIHLVAHSMGNRALIEALGKIGVSRLASAATPMFGQVVFTAPDVDRDYFVDVIDQIKGFADRITLYASENDMALHSSAVLHGAPRAGLAGDSIVTATGIDTIDMSDVDADALGHNYFVVNEGALHDLFRLLWRDESPGQRCGMNSKSDFWSFNAELCSGKELMDAWLVFKKFGADAKIKALQKMNSLTAEDEDGKQEWARIMDRLDGLVNAE